MKQTWNVILMLLAINIWCQNASGFIDEKLDIVRGWGVRTSVNELTKGVSDIISDCEKKGFSPSDLSQLKQYYRNQIQGKLKQKQGESVRKMMINMLETLKTKKIKTQAQSSLSTHRDDRPMENPDPKASISEAEIDPVISDKNEGFGGSLVTDAGEGGPEQEDLPLNVLNANYLKMRLDEVEKRVELTETSAHGLNNWALVLLLGWVIAAGLVLVLLIALRMQGKRLSELEFQLKRLIRN